MHSRRALIISALEQDDLDAVAVMVKDSKKDLNHLIRIAYNKETLLGWRAIKAVGLVAKHLVNTDYAFLRETARKLFWTLNDESGGIGWAAPEMLGEIISSDPEKFADLIPIIAEVYDVEEDVFRAGVLYALSRIAEENASLVMPYKRIIFQGLSDKEALVRFYSLKLLDKIKGLFSKEDFDIVSTHLEILAEDRAEVWVYENEDFYNVQIGEYGKAAKEKLANRGA